MAVSTTTTTTGALGYTIGDAIINFNEGSVFKNIINMVKVQPGTVIARIPVYAALDIDDVENGEGSNATMNTLVSSPVDISVERNYYAVEVTDLLAMGSGDDVNGTAGFTIGRILAKKFDAQVSALIAGLSQSVGTAAATLSLSDIDEAVGLLDTADAFGEKFLVLHPKQLNGPKGVISLMTASSLGEIVDGAVINGYVGKLYGAHVIKSNAIVIDDDDDATGVMFTSDAFSGGYKGENIDNMVTIEVARNAPGAGNQLVGNSYFKVAESNDLHGVQVISDVS